MVLNLLLLTGMLILQISLLFVLPRLVASSVMLGCLMAPAILLSLPLWALIHECMHGVLTGRHRFDQAAGRVLSVLFGAPYRILRAGHLLHHRYNRQTQDRSEIYDARQRTRVRAALSYYAVLLGGLYLAEILALLLFWLPLPVLRALRRRLDDEAGLAGRIVDAVSGRVAVLFEVRLDAFFTLSLWGMAFITWGARWWILALMLFGRAVLISLHDNLYHYATALDGHSVSTPRLPALVSSLLLHFNYHATHHRYPRLGWQALPRRFLEERGEFTGYWGRMLLRQLRGPLPESG